MKKRFQNKVAESRMSLPVTGTYAAALWVAVGMLLCGLQTLWMQMACFALTTYLMVELNNTNALIRVYSRMVSCAFIVLSCLAASTFASRGEAIAELCLVVAYTTLLRSYQDRKATGWIYYTFLSLALGTMVDVHLLYYVPVVWLLMAVRIQSMAWRTLMGSLLGLTTPYWIGLAFLLYQGDLTPAIDHFAPLAEFSRPLDFSSVPPGELIAAAFVCVLAIVGAAHFIATSYNDKIRTRMFYDSFILVTVLTALFYVLQPIHHDLLLRVLTVNASMLIAHFVALSHSRWSNLAFILILIVSLLLTALNLWMPSLISL